MIIILVTIDSDWADWVFCKTATVYGIGFPLLDFELIWNCLSPAPKYCCGRVLLVIKRFVV